MRTYHPSVINFLGQPGVGELGSVTDRTRASSQWGTKAPAEARYALALFFILKSSASDILSGPKVILCCLLLPVYAGGARVPREERERSLRNKPEE